MLFHMYIALGRGRQHIGDKILMTTEMLFLFAHMLQVLSIYHFIRHTPSNEYLQHAIKVKDKIKADNKKGIKVQGVSVLYSRNEKR